MFQLQNEKIMLVSDWWSGMCWVRTFGRHPTTKDVTDWLEQIYLLQCYMWWRNPDQNSIM